MLTHFLLLALLTSAFIYGFHYATLYDYPPGAGGRDHNPKDAVHKEILWFLRLYTYNVLSRWPQLKQWLWKPTFGCVVCMASVYGTFIYWLWIFTFHGVITLKTFILWPVFLVVVAGINRLLKGIDQVHQ